MIARLGWVELVGYELCFEYVRSRERCFYFPAGKNVSGFALSIRVTGSTGRFEGIKIDWYGMQGSRHRASYDFVCTFFTTLHYNEIPANNHQDNR